MLTALTTRLLVLLLVLLAGCPLQPFVAVETTRSHERRADVGIVVGDAEFFVTSRARVDELTDVFNLGTVGGGFRITFR